MHREEATNRKAIPSENEALSDTQQMQQNETCETAQLENFFAAEWLACAKQKPIRFKDLCRAVDPVHQAASFSL